ncbi:hypothetical protein CONCODRAFT_78829 [Conidiobolus coronatus NRRL 28638]|uniref:Mitochondrial import inner membrane translocase subunit Tim21 n=1 Tax=Conidiobolus coronatus (strain ATCC 28846 / CBS 209.66 / NRRL 28638) TaxID=796925 RepID=A0A137P6A7_CONC2|nr:hypothetical protein CONCODRAFT_78829 [Conidiobolus coronatus NRRL 28638]|eukprot:KXN70461.1 hypothetical protein CONCODRAFT_78829 [Conidiobolus coronatus NRRL 28638]
MINKNINKLVRTDIVKRVNSQLINTIKYSSSTSSSHPNITNNKAQWKETKAYRVIKKVVLGASAIGILLYVLGDELYNGSTQTTLFNKTFDLVKDNRQIQNLVGENIMAHGDPVSTRRRRSHIHFSTHYPKSGNPELITQYYIEGSRNTGTVHACMTQINDEWKYKWLMVEVPGEGLPSRKVTIKGDETKFGGR